MSVRAAEGVQFNAYETFTIITCYKCGMPFGVPKHWKQERREDKGSFYCPNGHVQAYYESEASRLRKELEREKRRAESARNSERFYRERAEHSKRSAAAFKGQATKRKKQLDRVAKGVCPCCNRHFENLQRHMETKHPELSEASE